jgi:Primase X
VTNELASDIGIIQQKVAEGLDFILKHFTKEEIIWPRKISTKTTEGRQILVRNKEEALARFKQANHLDCRISAYPFREDWAYSLLGPYFIFINLDLEHFRSLLGLNRASDRTLRNIKTAFRDDTLIPSKIWSGNGYHIYLPVQAFVPESETIFADLIESSECSRRFLQFAEKTLSDDKADKCHTTNLSFKNCMLRIPGSINSTSTSRSTSIVRIVQRWNAVRPSIKPLLVDFYIYLQDIKLKRIVHQQRENSKNRNRNGTENLVTHKFSNSSNRNNNHQVIPWIDALLETPIVDYRKFVIWRILAPYLINIKKLSYDEAFDQMRNWLANCDRVRRLDFNIDQRIKGNLRAAIK